MSITELIWQAKTWEESNQEVGHLRFVVFQSLAYRIHIEIWMRLHFLGHPLDVNRLLKLEWRFYYKGGAHETSESVVWQRASVSWCALPTGLPLVPMLFWRQRNSLVGTLLMFYVKNILTIDSIHRLICFYRTVTELFKFLSGRNVRASWRWITGQNTLTTSGYLNINYEHYGTNQSFIVDLEF